MRRALAVLGLVLVLPLMGAKCSGAMGRPGGHLPTYSRGDWLSRGLEGIKIGSYPVPGMPGEWVQIGWTRGGKRVWMPRRQGIGPRPAGASGP